MEIEQYLRAFVAGWEASGSNKPVPLSTLKDEALRFAAGHPGWTDEPFGLTFSAANIAAEKLDREINED